MTSLSYEEIFSDFMGFVTDSDIASLEISEAYVIMTEYLHKVLSRSYVRRLFSSVAFDDETLVLSFEIKTKVDEGSDKDFVKYILSKGMVIEWLEPQVKKTSLIHQHITSSKESKFYSQSQHISELRGLLEDTKLDLRKQIGDRGYIYNSYLSGEN